MKMTKLRVKNLNSNYSIIVGRNVLNQIGLQTKILCPRAQKIALVVDKLLRFRICAVLRVLILGWCNPRGLQI